MSPMISIMNVFLLLVSFCPIRSTIHLALLFGVNLVFLIVIKTVNQFKHPSELSILTLLYLAARILSFFLNLDYLGSVLVTFLLISVYFLLNHRQQFKEWFRFHPVHKMVPLTLLYTFLSVIGLVLWDYFSTNNTLILPLYLVNMTIPKLILVGISFTLINAFYEEMLFRGYFWHALKKLLPGKIVLIIQAVIFGLIHYLGGFPSGLFGIVLTFMYGLLMGHLYLKSRSLIFPVLSHIICDFAIFGIMTTK